MTSISTSIGKLALKNPTLLASGIMDEDSGSMKRMITSGAGGIVTKSIGLLPREGYPNPTVIELECGIINAMGLPNPGIDEYKHEILDLKNQHVPIIGSIFGATADEFIQLAQKMQDYGCAAVELNLSCPHAKQFGLEVGSDPNLVHSITLAVKNNVDIPVYIKLSPNLTNIVANAQAAEKANADAIVAINTVKAMKIDIDFKRPVLANKIGGYSGKAIKPIGVRCVYEIAEQIDIPIIGVGGVTTGNDIIEYMMAGACAVQIGSAVYYRGIDVFAQVCLEVENWMKQYEYENISDIIGVAHT